MASEIIRKVWCDKHLTDQDTRVEASVSETIKVGARGGQIDLCEACATELLEPLQEVLRLSHQPDGETTQRPPSQQSKPPSAPAPGNQDYKCPWCPTTTKTRQTFRIHLQRDHNKGFEEYLRSVGKEAFPCDERGCDFVGVDVTGLALHKSRMHPALMAASNGRR